MALRSTFAAFETAKSGLFMAQKQMDVTTHNMANVDTLGYTRQMFITKAIDPYGTLQRFSSPTTGGKIGQGVQPMSLTQIRNIFLDVQFRQEFASEGQYEIRQDGMYQIEDIFNEIDDTSLDKLMQEFFSSFSNTSAEKANDDEYRTIIRSNAELLITQFHTIYSHLEQLQLNYNDSIKTIVGEINSIAEQIDILNDRIFKVELTGEQALDLRDQRNLLIDELSKLTDLTYSEDSHGRVTIDIGGNSLVFPRSSATGGIGYVRLEIDTDGSKAVDGTTDLYCIKWTETAPGGGWNLTGDILTPKNGTLAGYFAIRDGEGPTGDPTAKGIPYYLNMLDTLANELVEAFNEIHLAGWTKNTATPPAASTSEQGIYFFEPNLDASGDPLGVTAKTIALHQDIIDSIANIALSSKQVEADDTQQTGNGLNAQALYNLYEKKNVGSIGNFATYYTSLVADLAVEAGRISTSYTSQQKLTASIDQQRAAVSSVSIDEETANLVMFQHAYNAAARCLTTLDEALDHLINRTGRVGL